MVLEIKNRQDHLGNIENEIASKHKKIHDLKVKTSQA